MDIENELDEIGNIFFGSSRKLSKKETEVQLIRVEKTIREIEFGRTCLEPPKWEENDHKLN